MKRGEVTPEAFEELFRRSAPEVRAYLRRRVGPDADDLLGDVFVIAWQRRRDLPEPALRRAWLFGVARRLILANARQTFRMRDSMRDLSRLGDVVAGEAEERTAAIRRAVESLPDTDRELIMLTVWERLPIAEAAVVLGVRPGTARVRLHRARQRLAADPALRALVQPAAGNPVTS